MTAASTDLLVRDVLEAECRQVMALRVSLKRQPGTHAEQYDLMLELDCLLDRWLEVVADDGLTAARVR